MNNFLFAFFDDSDRNIAFRIFGMDIYWYAIFALTGFIVCTRLIWWLLKSKGHNPDMAFDIVLIALPLGIIGARFWYVIFENVAFADFFNIRNGGLAWHGGVILVSSGLVVYALCIKKINPFVIFDVCAVALSLGMAIGRFGNQINGELFGDLIAQDSAFRFFPFALKGRGNENYYVNIPFYEQLFCLVIFAGTLIWYRKNSASRPGLVMPFYLIGYGITRTILEPLRAEQYQMSGSISIIISIMMIIVGIAIFVYFYYIYFYKESSKNILPKHVADVNKQSNQETADSSKQDSDSENNMQSKETKDE